MPTTLPEWLAWISQQHPSMMDLGLDRIKTVAKQLNLTQPSCPVITVAGTNGKGSCVATIEAIALSAGLRVGCYTSPHIHCFNERVRIDGNMITDAELCDTFANIAAHTEQTTLTYFEYATLAALYCFSQQPLDLIVLEVGLGGRLDAVNMIDPDVAVIMSIDLDHQAWLGDTREAIAAEKAGIIRQGKPVVCADLHVPQAIIQSAKRLSAPLFCQGQDFNYRRNRESWQWLSDNQVLRDLPIPAVLLQNASTAIMALQCLSSFDFPQAVIANGLKKLNLPGRLQYVPGEPAVLLDVAHNPQAMRNLAEHLKTQQHKPVHIVLGMLEDKAIVDSLEPLANVADFWHLASLDVPRGAKSIVLAQALNQLGVKQYKRYPSASRALEACMQVIPEDGLVVVAGSFHTVAAFEAAPELV